MAVYITTLQPINASRLNKWQKKHKGPFARMWTDGLLRELLDFSEPMGLYSCALCDPEGETPYFIITTGKHSVALQKGAYMLDQPVLPEED